MALPSWTLEITVYISLIVAVIGMGIALLTQGHLNQENLYRLLQAILAALRIGTTEGDNTMSPAPAVRSPDGEQALPLDRMEIRGVPVTAVPPNTDVTGASDDDTESYIEMREIYSTLPMRIKQTAETMV